MNTLITQVLKADEKAISAPWEVDNWETTIGEAAHIVGDNTPICVVTRDHKNTAPLIALYRTAAPILARNLEKAMEAHKIADRLLIGKYTSWAKSGGVNDCEHGYGEGIPCPACDLFNYRVTIAEIQKEIEPK